MGGVEGGLSTVGGAVAMCRGAGEAGGSSGGKGVPEEARRVSRVWCPTGGPPALHRGHGKVPSRRLDPGRPVTLRSLSEPHRRCSRSSLLGPSGPSPGHRPLSLPLPALHGLTDACLPPGAPAQGSPSRDSGHGARRCGQDPVQEVDGWGGGWGGPLLDQGWELTLPSGQSGRASWQRGPSKPALRTVTTQLLGSTRTEWSPVLGGGDTQFVLPSLGLWR